MKDVFPGYRILGLQFYSLDTLNLSLYCLLIFFILNEKAVVTLTVYVMCFSLAAFQLFLFFGGGVVCFLSLVFSSLIIMSPDVIFFELLFLGVL